MSSKANNSRILPARSAVAAIENTPTCKLVDANWGSMSASAIYALLENFIFERRLIEIDLVLENLQECEPAD